MIRHSHKLLLAAVLSGFSALSAGTVDAGCHGRSGGSYGGSHSSSHSYSQSSYHSPVYSQPVYQQPVYSQPSYPQQVYSQPSYPQSGYPQSGYPQQPVYSQNSYGQSQPLYGQQPQQLPQQQAQQFPQTQQAQTLQPLQQTQQMAPQQQQQTPLSQTQVQSGNVQLNVSQTGLAQTGLTQAVAPQSLIQTNSAPTQVAAQAPTLAGGPTAGNTAPVNDATQSALLALGGFGPPQTATTQAAVQAPQTQQPAFTGTWTANLSNGARVQLLLQADGSFSWTAVNKDGQSSSFQGSYSMDNGSLSLSRSTDGQKLSGSLTNGSANSFSFKLSDAQASSLDFVRG